VIHWIEQESREHCHVIGLITVLVVYFGGEEGSYPEFYNVEDFFKMHEPERIHS
jgi:hypothetical protein